MLYLVAGFMIIPKSSVMFNCVYDIIHDPGKPMMTSQFVTKFPRIATLRLYQAYQELLSIFFDYFFENP